MQLVITLRREVEDAEEGKRIYEVVKTQLESRPDIKITGHITNHFAESEEPK